MTGAINGEAEFQVVDLRRYGLARVADAAVRAFSDYAVPLDLSPASLQRLIDRDDVDLDASLALDNGGELSGFALLAQRGPSARIAMMGVDPALRRRGGGGRLTGRAIETLGNRAATRIVLEVLETNAIAARLYRRLGFRPTRELVGHARPPESAAAAEGVDLETVAPVSPAIYANAAREHADPDLPWQLARAPLHPAEGREQTFALRRGGACCWVATPSSGAAVIRGLIVDRQMRRQGRARELLAGVTAALPDRDWSVPALVPLGGASDLTLTAAGFAHCTRQLEMELRIG